MSKSKENNNDKPVGLLAFAIPTKGSRIVGCAQAIINTKTSCPCKKSTPARNFPQLIELVKQAEEMLISNGIDNINDRICILRGIYYGTTWSMDYGNEESNMRNWGFKLYTFSMPKDARPLLKCSDNCKSDLYESLKKSPEVNLGTNNGFDWGHAIIGLDCRRSIISMNVSSIGGTGLENCTWLGDIGGGAGMLAYRRTTNGKTRAKSVVFDSIHDYGCATNLEGDIGGYLIAREMKTSYSDEVGIDDNQIYLYEALNKYLIEDSSEWKNRGMFFLQMLGGKFSNNQLTNKTELVKKISDKVVNFADIYIMMRSTDKNYSHNSLKEASRHFDGVADEVSLIFVDALLNIIKFPQSKLSAATNPEPSEPGEVWDKYETAKKIEDIMKTGKKTIEKVMKKIIN